MTRQGRKFDTFVYERDAVRREIEIRVSGKGEQTKFYAYDEELDIRVESKLVGEVHKYLREEMDKRYESKWDIFVEVTIESNVASGWHDEKGRTLKVVFRPIALGTNADGQPIHSDARWKHDSMGDEDDDRASRWHGKKPVTWNGEWRLEGSPGKGHPKYERISLDAFANGSSFDTGREVKVIIPGTIDNVNALLRFEFEMRQFARRIAERFNGPDEAQQLLSAISKSTKVPLLGDGK